MSGPVLPETIQNLNYSCDDGESGEFVSDQPGRNVRIGQNGEYIVDAGSEFEFTIRMENTGTIAWKAEHIWLKSGTASWGLTDGKFPIEGLPEVAPGSLHDFHLTTLKAPEVKREQVYQFYWQLTDTRPNIGLIGRPSRLITIKVIPK